ncbi:MAG TPA: hypothetical protein VFG86_02535 [Chloroflexota bacterium]|jgi:hypothetical protein|nr:hypothetical protein [Chloroflexota bacterium]
MKLQSDAESSPPKRSSPDALGKPLVKTAPRRFRWRAVIHSAGKKLDPSGNQPTVAWHLADCDAPTDLEAHCEIGRQLAALDGNPDGHCLVGGACPRCPELAEAAEAAAAASAAAEAKANEPPPAVVAEPPEPGPVAAVDQPEQPASA